MTLIDMIWKIYQEYVWEADILLAKDTLYSFEVTLMSSYFSFLIYGSVWHLYENKHRKKIALSGIGKFFHGSVNDQNKGEEKHSIYVQKKRRLFICGLYDTDVKYCLFDTL